MQWGWRGGKKGGETRGRKGWVKRGGAQVWRGAAGARPGRGRRAEREGRGRGGGGEGVTLATSGARGFARERLGRWAWLQSFSGGRAGRRRRLLKGCGRGGVGVSGVIS